MIRAVNIGCFTNQQWISRDVNKKQQRDQQLDNSVSIIFNLQLNFHVVTIKH